MNNTDNAKLRNYVIVYQDNGYADYNRDLALHMQDRLSNMHINIPIMPDSEEPVENEILIGHTNREESEAAYTGFFAPERMRYTIDLVGKKYVLAGYEWFSTKKAIDVVCDAIEGGKAPEACCIKNQGMHSPCPGRCARYRALHYNVMVEWLGWGCGGILEGPIYKRREPLANIVLGYAPDFICFCEVFERWSVNLAELFGDKYSFICLDRADNNASNRTPLAYDRKKFRLIEGGYENLYSNQFINHRVITWGLLEERETGNRILVCGTHWDSSGNEDDLLKEARACEELINQKREQYGVEVILMGDFNTRRGFRSYEDLVESCSLIDVEDEELSRRSVDHVFVSRQVKVVSCTRENGKSGQFASDHPPVICDFNI